MPGERAKRPKGEAAPSGGDATAPAPGKQQQPANGGLTVLHRARIVPWSVAAVTAIAACPSGEVFAAGYEDGKVEVFDATHFNKLATIPGSDGNEISGLAWARGPADPHWRLFASTLSGQLLELSCQQAQAVAATDSGGGPIWSLQAAPCSSSAAKGAQQRQQQQQVSTQLAAACGDGSVRLFSVASGVDGAVFERSLPRVGGNVLALAWHPNGTSLASGGSDGCIHLWDAVTGKESRRITVGTSSTSPPCVWALLVLPDGTVVSADQEGAVQFWDGAFGTLLARHQQHAADVLALAASQDGASVWASGVDPKVALYQHVADKATSAPRWAYLDRKQPHTHDVRALALLAGRPDGGEPLLLSGGNDGQLVLYSGPRFLKEHPIRQSRSPQAPLLALATAASPAGLLMQVAQRTINVWQLGRAAPAAAAAAVAAAPGGASTQLEGDQWDLAALPSKLASISTSSTAHIISAALAPDGSAVAASDRHKLRLFALARQPADALPPPTPGTQQSQQEQQVIISRVKLQQAGLDAPVVACAFSADGSLLFAVTGKGHVAAFEVASGQQVASQQLQAATPAGGGSKVTQQQQQQQQQPWCAGLAWAMPAASQLVASPDGRFIAVATPSRVQLLSAAPGGSLLALAARLALLGEPAAVTALAFNTTGALLAAATAANSLAVYDTDTGLPTQWSTQQADALAALLEGLPGSISGLSFRPSPSQPACLVAFSPGGLCHVDMDAPLPAADRDVVLAGGSSGAGGGKQRRKRRKQAARGGVAPPAAVAQVGRNGRLLQLQHCCLLVGHLSAGEALLLEKPWSEVLQGLTPPLYRHRYGA